MDEIKFKQWPFLEAKKLLKRLNNEANIIEIEKMK